MAKKSNGLGDRIRRIREARAFSQSDLAKMANVTPTAVWNWETNGVVPRAETLLVVAQRLGVTKEYLLTGQSGVQDPATSASTEELSLEDLIRAIAAKGFEVSIRPKSPS
ncbi:helix-turn-helix domain-containing protein [Methyloceanibacter caenitepidi]|uniref:helix-turn-helix domain-containing protein n=1 Tax=Methyloceanibacter caenitepidi TaxID=1384459 RepID=UPI0009E3DA2E